jgi:putative hydrolase of the HAD superfamily
LIEVVISDFGGVVTTPIDASFWAFARQFDIPLETVRAALDARTARDGAHPLHVLEVGAMTEAEFVRGLSEDLAVLGHNGIPTDGFAEAYFGHLRPNMSMIAELRNWKARGLRLAMLTNNVAEWEPHWRAMLPVDELFETVVDSAFVGVRKPDPRIYEITLERLGVEASACVLIDDLAENCAAATELGMHAVHFFNTATTIAAVEQLLRGIPPRA